MAGRIFVRVFGGLAVAVLAGFAAALNLAAQNTPSVQPQQSEMAELVYSPWVKVCNKAPDPNAKPTCVIVKDGRTKRGLLVVSVAIVEPNDTPRKMMRVRLPYGVQLPAGIRVLIDRERSAIVPYQFCLPPDVPPSGCIADYEATPDVLDRMKKGQLLTVQAIHRNNQPLSPQLDLRDFAKVYDGPPTADPRSTKRI